MMKAFTSRDDNEIKWCLEMLQRTDAGTGFMHESFNCDDASKFTRAWFAWQNTLFGELILKLVDERPFAERLNNKIADSRGSTFHTELPCCRLCLPQSRRPILSSPHLLNPMKSLSGFPK